ncbi:hypothetical protein BJY16_005008 [Actinoplanes octamycinicus]|uniref:Fibronectin type-III domain-containing protein n=1 Tax=Actinoplanes octamycinicus TaxID=135948 RepID=A0A7W7H079_9ACTN|nr:hypothetical protein [Actinoplanes octamycinicus]MBB4741549.1 hypothetical protein [Actinoplanes octamycinicus]GIE57101.1 hypothetical protein Aoc01nite_25030 [Actinoplanes octamycinicus]
MRFDPEDYRARVLSRLQRDGTLADPQDGDPFLVCAISLDATTKEVAEGLDHIVAFWRKEETKFAYRVVTGELLRNQEAYRRLLGPAASRVGAAARVRQRRAAEDQAARAELDRLAGLLRKEHGALHRDKVKVLESIAIEEGMSRSGFATWLSRQSVADRLPAAQPWDTMVRRRIRSALDELARIDKPRAGRYRTLFTFLAVPSAPSRAALEAAHEELSRQRLSMVRETPIATRTHDVLTEVKLRLLVDGGIERYAASVRADAQDMLATELRRRAKLTGVLHADEVEAMVGRIVQLRWGIEQDEATSLVRAAAAAEKLAVEVNIAVRLIVCGACGRPQTADGQDTCVYCAELLYVGCLACGESIPRAAEICPRCTAPIAALRLAETIAPALRQALDEGRAAQAYRLALDINPLRDHPAASRGLVALIAEAEQRHAEAGRRWTALLADIRRGAWWSAMTAAQWLTTQAGDVVSPEPASPWSAAARLKQIEEAQRAAITAVRRAAALPAESREEELQRLLTANPDCPEAIDALARIPLRPPESPELVVTEDAAQLSWRPVRGASPDVVYHVQRHVEWPEHLAEVTSVGRTKSTRVRDACAPGGTVVRYTVTAADGDRVSPSVDVGSSWFVTRDVLLVHATAVGRRAVQLEWPPEYLGAAEVLVERRLDAETDGGGPVKRFRPAAAGRYFDETVELGVAYRYRVCLAYRDRVGTVTRTAGREAVMTVHPAPEPVRELRVVTGGDGRTVISYDSPPAGTVRVYATAGTRPPEGRTLRQLEASGARPVGEGAEQVVDDSGRGLVTYRAVTVSGPDIALGAYLTHVAAETPGRLRVIDDSDGRLRLGFDWPVGVSTAVVRWSRLGPPGEGADQATVTAAQLAGDGYPIEVPADGRAVHVAVHAAIPSGGWPVVASAGATMLARPAVPLVVRYSVNVRRFLGPRVDIDVSTAGGGPLPAVVVVLRGDGEPAGPDDGVTVCSYPGGSSSVELQIKRADLVDGHLRLFARPEPGFVVEVQDPPLTSRRVVL